MSAPELAIGSVVAGKYTIRSLLLRGGPTATYRAVAAKNREVVLKVYDPAILSFPDLLKTLAQHKSISAKLPAHHIVSIAESGTDPNSGAPFTVSDFESLPSLAQLIDRGPLSASAMVALVRNLASTTDLLHSNGITSLSLHPGNVFVRLGDPYEVRVADFGGSVVRRSLPAPEKAGRWMPWLAPEQIKGQDAPSPAADIFALGLIAFFAVTGKSYWRSSQQKVPDTAALRREILGQRMPASVRASEFSITLNPVVDAVFARVLAFRPTDRYSTAREFAAGLEAALSGRSADAAPNTQRMAAPAPRRMPQRATMVGMGSSAAENPTGPSATTGGPRPPMSTMLGMGEAAAAAVAAAPAIAAAPPPATTPAKISPPPLPTAAAKGAPAAKTSAPAMTPAPAKASPPAMTAAPAKTATPQLTPTAQKAPPPANAPPAAALATPVIALAPATSPTPPTPATTATWAALAMPVGPAMPAESPMVVPSARAAQRGGPPPLPMAPPPGQLEEVLAQFEAGAPDLQPRAPSPTPSTAGADVVQMPPAWSTAEHGDSGGERVETGVGVVGAVTAHTPKNTRVRWVASICGLLVLIGGAALALSGGTSGSRGPAASDAKATATTPAKVPSISAESPRAAVQAPSANAMQQGAEETPNGAAPEPAAVAPPAPAADEPEGIVPDKSAPTPTLTPPTGPIAQPSKKPCGKFLKRCD